MPEGISAQGTLVAMSPDPLWPPASPVGGAVSFTDIAELRDITPSPLSRNPIEMTTHNEDADAYVVGIKRRGEFSFNVNYVPTNATHSHTTGLLKNYEDGSRNIYRVTYPDGTAWLFSGFVTNFAPTAPVDDRLAADVSLRPTGPHEWQAPV